MINSLIKNNDAVFSAYIKLFNNDDNAISDIAQTIVAAAYPLICFIITIIFATIMVLLLIYLERRILALFTLRFGPNRVGYEGILQTFADAIKLLLKEDCAPKTRKKVFFFMAPFIVLCPVVTAFCLLPFNNFYIQSNIEPSIILLMALASIPVIGVFLAGFSSNNKYGLIGAARSIIQAVSFEIPIGVSILAITFMTGSLNINDIIQSQSSNLGLFGWHFIPQIIGCIVFFISALALLNRTPFDLSEAESELVAGYATEYSGIKFALFFFSEYLLLFLISVLFVCLFFGGYLSPFGTYVLPESLIFIEQIFWLILKTFFIIFFIFLIRAALPRLRYDRVLEFSYKILLPLSLINLNIAVLIQYFMGAK